MHKILASSTLVLALGLGIATMGLAQGSQLVLEAQHALKDKGYDPGAMDGVYGPKTRTAVRDFEKNSYLPVDGLLSPQTLAALGVLNAGAERKIHTAGTNVKLSYASGGKQIGEGGKALGSDMKHGEVVGGAKEFGKGLGQGVANIGKGTGHAAANAAKSVKDAVTGNK
jgi:peptidoglycan hydrolase-like protein with peptidoglycan-binding domain